MTPIAAVVQFSLLMLVQAVDGNYGHRYLTTQPGSYVVPVVREGTDMDVSTYDATYHNYVACTAPIGTASVWDPTTEIIDFKYDRKQCQCTDYLRTGSTPTNPEGLSCGEILVWFQQLPTVVTILTSSHLMTVDACSCWVWLCLLWTLSQACFDSRH